MKKHKNEKPSPAAVEAPPLAPEPPKVETAQPDVATPPAASEAEEARAIEVLKTAIDELNSKPAHELDVWPPRREARFVFTKKAEAEVNDPGTSKFRA